MVAAVVKAAQMEEVGERMEGTEARGEATARAGVKVGVDDTMSVVRSESGDNSANGPTKFEGFEVG